MLINKTCLAWAICCWTIVAAAQSNQPDYDKIYSENPPAFTILGVEPTTIERPGTPQKFAASVQNLFQNGKPQPGFALEFTPGLWRTDSLILNSKAYIENTSLTKYFWQHLSFSVATSSTDSSIYGNLAPGTGYSIGGKLLLLSGKPSEKTQNKLHELDEAFATLAGYNAFISGVAQSQLLTSSRLNTQKEELLKLDVINGVSKQDVINLIEMLLLHLNDKKSINVAEFDSLAKANPEKKDAFHFLKGQMFEDRIDIAYIDDVLLNLNAIVADERQKEKIQIAGQVIKNIILDKKVSYILVSDLNSIVTELQMKIAEMDITVEREGPMLEIAGAGMSALPDNKWDNHIAAAKIGFWVNYTHRINLSKNGLEDNNKYFDFGGVARYIINKQSSSVKIDSSNYFDFGAKAGFQINKAKIAGEYIHRVITNKPESLKEGYTWRLTLNFEYQFTDAIGIKVSFGKGFDGNTLYYDNNDQQFLGVAGLNVSLPGIK